jgi:hypothetical protein
MLTIKDLSSSKELDRDALTHVRGGSNFAAQGGQAVAVGGGFSFANPVNVIKADVITQNDNDVLLNVLSPLGLNSAF